jgi:hypothetical protein
MLIGLSGPAQSGKDSFFNIAEKHFLSLNLKCKRLALADNLKDDLKDFIHQKFNIDIFNISQEDKELIRDLLVVYGKIKRQQTAGKYWIDLINKELEQSLKEYDIVFITDIRYAYYPEDELNWVKKFKNNILIHISRFDEHNKIIPPRNLEEELNDPILKQNSNHKLAWHTSQDLNVRIKEMEPILNKIYEQYKLSK